LRAWTIYPDGKVEETPQENVSGPEMFTIYDKPSDYPNSYVVRRVVLAAGQIQTDATPLMVGVSLEAIRAFLRSRGCVNIGRQPGDDPVILEVWV
jgi:hypothetical protein